jgi:hypothetical protein
VLFRGLEGRRLGSAPLPLPRLITPPSGPHVGSGKFGTPRARMHRENLTARSKFVSVV